MSKWMMSAWTFNAEGAQVDREAGAIRNAAIVTVGEAKGHGVELEQEFIDETVKQGNELKNGVKVRFGHPSMSSTALGTFLGRAKNFRTDGSVARADIFLSNQAKEAPGGDLYSYVLGMAQDEPDMFGMSIVFKPGKEYQRNEDGEKMYSGLNSEKPTYVEMGKLLAADFVDDPAANENGLFSSRFNNDTIAGQVSEFLDTHPQVWELLEQRPDIIESFMGRYRDYLSRKDVNKDFDETNSNEALSVDSAEQQSASVDAPNKEKTMDREEFAKIREEFGSDIAAQVFAEGGDMSDAKSLATQLKLEKAIEERDGFAAENEDLKAEIAELNEKLSAITDGEPAPVSPNDGDGAEEEPVVEKVDVQAKVNEYRAQGLGNKEALKKVATEYPEEFKAYHNKTQGK